MNSGFDPAGHGLTERWVGIIEVPHAFMTSDHTLSLKVAKLSWVRRCFCAQGSKESTVTCRQLAFLVWSASINPLDVQT